MPSHSFDESGFFRAVVQSAACFRHYRVQAVREVNKDIRWPELVPEFFPGHDFIRVPQQDHQRLEGFFFQRYAQPVFAQFAGAKIGLIHAKTQGTLHRLWGLRGHILLENE